MANNYATQSAEFQPFTFDQLIKPVLMADQEHKAIEDKMGEVDMKRALIAGQINQEKDDKAYETQRLYEEELRNASDALSTQGLRGLDRKKFLNLSAKYNSEIAPIERAIQSRNDLKKLQTQAEMADSSTIISEMASDLSLDTFIENPEYTPMILSGNQIYQTSAQAFSNFSKRIRAHGMSTADMQGYLKEYISRGMTETEALKVMFGEETSQEYQSIIDNVAQSFGVDKWEKYRGKDEIMSNIRRGALSGIGQDDIRYNSDKVWDFQKQLALIDYQNAAAIKLANSKPVTQKAGSGSKKGKEDKEDVVRPTLEYEVKTVLTKDEMENRAKKVAPLLTILEELKDENLEFNEESALKMFENKEIFDAYKMLYGFKPDAKLSELDLPESREELVEMLEDVNEFNKVNQIGNTHYKVNATKTNAISSHLLSAIQVLDNPLTVNGTLQGAKEKKRLITETGIRKINNNGTSKSLSEKEYEQFVKVLNGVVNRVIPGVQNNINIGDMEVFIVPGESMVRVTLPQLSSDNLGVTGKRDSYHVPIETILSVSGSTNGGEIKNQGRILMDRINSGYQLGDSQTMIETVDALSELIMLSNNVAMPDQTRNN